MECKRVLFAFYTQFSLFPPPLEFASIANEIVGTSVVIFSSSFLSFLDFHVSAICTASRFLFPYCCHLHHQICGCFLTTEDTSVPCRTQKRSTDTCCLAMLNKASLYICDYCRTCYFLPNAHHPVYL